MNILIIGGTRFQGRYLINELLDAGHHVTVFHRGQHAISQRHGLIDLIGDRNVPVDLAGLASRKFDACIDTCAYFPTQIELLSNFLETKYYCLMSSTYVYADRDSLLDENATMSHIPEVTYSGLTPENYGALKALCEEMAFTRFGNACLAIRPSIIIGMGDHTERLLFWMRLLAVHGKRLDIAGREPVVQLVDVRDLANFTARCIEGVKQGAVNVCGEPVSLSELLDAIESISNHQCERRSALAEDLPILGLEQLPYCETGRFARHDVSLSRTWGFTGRSLRDSLDDIFNDLKQQQFLMGSFQDEEAAVLRLFER